MNTLCPVCQKGFYVKPSYVSKRFAHCCSRACSVIYRKAANPVESRFWGKVDKSGDCWLWIGSTIGNGLKYGQFRHGREVMAHRVSWVLKNGPIPDAMFVCHSCDVPLCVNPDHLWLGSCDDNLKDMAKKGRSTKGNDTVSYAKRHRGSSHFRSVLNEDMVSQMRQLYKDGVSMYKIMEMFSLAKSTVWNVLSLKTWRHV